VNLCAAPLLRFRGDTARCGLRFEHLGECRVDPRTHHLNVLATFAAVRGNTWTSLARMSRTQERAA
jgi:hypothetical protein